MNKIFNSKNRKFNEYDVSFLSYADCIECGRITDEETHTFSHFYINPLSKSNTQSLVIHNNEIEKLISFIKSEKSEMMLGRKYDDYKILKIAPRHAWETPYLIFIEINNCDFNSAFEQNAFRIRLKTFINILNSARRYSKMKYKE